MKYTKILIDLDDCIISFDKYPELVSRLEENITNWISIYLNISKTSAKKYKNKLYIKYGGIPQCLASSNILRNAEDIKEATEFINNIDVSFVKPDYKLIETIKASPLPIIIFTNATKSYAKQILDSLKISKFVEDVISIENMKYQYKSSYESYSILEKITGDRLENLIMVDDSLKNLKAAKKAGIGLLIWCSKTSKEMKKIISIKEVYEILEIF